MNFVLDSRDRINTLIALISFWEIKCESIIEDHTSEFAELLKDRILKQRKSLEDMRADRLPSPETLSVLLLPRNEEISKFVSSAGFNPKLQLSVSSNQLLSSIMDQLTRRWVDEDRKFIGSLPIRLYPHGALYHKGYGGEDFKMSVLAIYHSMGCPNTCKLEYSFGGLSTHSLDQQSVSYDDESVISSESPEVIFKNKANEYVFNLDSEEYNILSQEHEESEEFAIGDGDDNDDYDLQRSMQTIAMPRYVALPPETDDNKVDSMLIQRFEGIMKREELVSDKSNSGFDDFLGFEDPLKGVFFMDPSDILTDEPVSVDYSSDVDH